MRRRKHNLTPSSNRTVLKSEEGLFELAGASFEYRWIKCATASTMTLVFLHEGLGSAASWKDFPDKLCTQVGCDGFIYSRESYGKSSRLNSPRQDDYHHYEACSVLAPLLQAFEIDNPVMIGHSDGATIALVYAAEEQLPRTGGLVLMAPHVFVEKETWSGVLPVVKAFKESGLRERLKPYHEDVDGAFYGWYDFWSDPNVLEWNIESILADIHQPLLLIQGEEDEYATRAQLDAIAKQSKGESELHMLNECRHTPYKDREATCLELMQSFVQRL